jgi:hypothetical protein
MHSNVSSDRPEPCDEDRRVVHLRPRGSAGRGARIWRLERHGARSPSAVEDLAKYEGGDGDDDYRHRMMVNLAALVFTILLAGAGAWLAINIAEMRKNQDCVLSGRKNCSPVDVTAGKR